MTKKPAPPADSPPPTSADVIAFPKPAKAEQRRADERWGKGVMARGTLLFLPS